jgi:hypothetical protein
MSRSEAVFDGLFAEVEVHRCRRPGVLVAGLFVAAFVAALLER